MPKVDNIRLVPCFLRCVRGWGSVMKAWWMLCTPCLPNHLLHGLLHLPLLCIPFQPPLPYMRMPSARSRPSRQQAGSMSLRTCSLQIQGQYIISFPGPYSAPFDMYCTIPNLMRGMGVILSSWSSRLTSKALPSLIQTTPGSQILRLNIDMWWLMRGWDEGGGIGWWTWVAVHGGWRAHRWRSYKFEGNEKRTVGSRACETGSREHMHMASISH